jgi:ribosomal protein S12 methylthiotransferase accessory factor
VADEGQAGAFATLEPEMLSRPRLRSSFEVVSRPPRELFLIEESRQVIFQGPVYLTLAGLLDGRRSLEDLARDAAPHPWHEILLALGQLEARGCLVDGPSELPRAEAAWFDALPGDTPPEPPAPIRVSVQALGGLDAAPMIDASARSGMTLDDASRADIEIVLTDDYLRPELASINREALRRSRPLLLVKPVGLVPWIGPLILPRTTACWSCLAQRLRSNRQMERYVLDRGGAPPYRSRAALPASVELAIELALTELRRWRMRPAPASRAERAAGALPGFLQAPPETASLAGRVVSFDLLSREMREHAVVKRPQCADCGDAGAGTRPPGPVVLASAVKRFRSDGGHRTLTPAETFERYRHHISAITGAVTDLRPALGRYDSELTPAYVAGHNFAMGVDSVVFLRDSLRGMSGGKGASPVQARVSGLCEAIERYSGIFSGEEYRLRGSLEALKPGAIHPNACMGFSEEQYRTREQPAPSRPPSRFLMVPRPLDPTLEVDWTPLWSLTHETERLLPTAYCYYGHPEFRDRWCIPDSNGCAAGNTLEEALLQGFMELIERDAVALWWYNRIRRAGVDLDSFQLPYLHEIREHYTRMNRSLWVLDISSDFDVTTLACVSARTSAPTQDILVGFGAHFDPKVALLRAVTEVNQFLPSVGYTRPDGTTIYLFGDDLARHWWTTARVEDLDYLRPDPDQPPRRASDFEDPSSDDLADDVRLCVEQARRHGLEVLVLDQTRPDLGLRVVRVAVPGLCHFWRRLGFERLYQVPVERGWLGQPLTPEQLNPYTIFF